MLKRCEKSLMLSGVERHKNNFHAAQLQAQNKISASVKIVCRYLGNQLFFHDDAMRR